MPGVESLELLEQVPFVAGTKHEVQSPLRFAQDYLEVCCFSQQPLEYHDLSMECVAVQQDGCVSQPIQIHQRMSPTIQFKILGKAFV